MTLKTEIKNKFKQTEIGEIPEDWEVREIKDIFDIQQGKSLSEKFRMGISPRLFLRTANVLWGKLDLSSVDEMDFGDEECKKLNLQKDDLLVCEGGDVGRTAIWNCEIAECSYQNHIHRLRAINKLIVFPKFIMYWMQIGFLHLKIYNGAANRTTIPNLSKTRLERFLIPLPPKPEQEEIANILTKIDNKIEIEEKKLEVYNELFNSMLDKLMTGKIRV